MDSEGQRSSVLGALSAGSGDFIALFRERLGDRRFWAVQALVLGITTLHALLEVTEVLGEHEAVSFIPVSFYFIPVVYAGLNFGMEGALPTALWTALLAVPNVMVWHEGTERIGELTQLAIMVSVAVLVARRVDEESRAKARAEQVSARLAQLNATAAAVNRSLEPAQVVREVLETVLKQGRADLAWIALAQGTRARLTLTVLDSQGKQTHELPSRWAEATERAAQTGLHWAQGAEDHGTDEATAVSVQAAVFPVRSVDRVLGALGAACEGDSLSEEDVSLLEAVAHQLAVALDNMGHFQKAKSALADLTQAQENLRTYLRLATEAQEEERKRLARELHDDTVQSLVVIRSNLDALATEGPAVVNERLNSLKKLMDSAVEDIRRFSRDLRPSLLDDLGLVHAIDWLVKDMSARTDIAASLEVEGEPRRLRGDVEVAVYRIVQEALRNVERHSGASAVRVSLSFGCPDLTAKIADDGQGFDTAEVLRHRGGGTGLGIVGMQERAKLAGGSLTIESEPGRGTLVAVKLDTEAAEAAAS